MKKGMKFKPVEKFCFTLDVKTSKLSAKVMETNSLLFRQNLKIKKFVKKMVEARQNKKEVNTVQIVK